MRTLAVLALGLTVIAPVNDVRPAPERITGCSTYKSGRSYGGSCTGVRPAKVLTQALCVKTSYPYSGRTSFGTYVPVPDMSQGRCWVGETATSIRIFQ